MQGKGKGIVIVDDETNIRSLLEETFETEGYNVYVAESGLRLVSILRSKPVDIILLDINMPWLSGLQICKSIKKDKSFKHIKIIYLSGAISKDEKKYYKSGCDGIIRKPFKTQDVIREIEKLTPL